MGNLWFVSGNLNKPGKTGWRRWTLNGGVGICDKDWKKIS